jgi:glutamyl-tRNA synthetase
MSSTPIVRFAPSPTGRIHIGNARTALLNWLFARRGAGRFILRFDDTDLARSRAEYAEAIEYDLAWLGIRPDLFYRQSERIPLYDSAAERLRDLGRLYPCYETAEELDRRRKRQQALGRPPIYDRAALRLTAEERAALEAQGRRPHWRFRLESEIVRWNDLVRGESHIDCASLSDPVLQREDGSYLYTFTSVVDDVHLGVTHVIRGEDHVTNTAVQIQIFEALAGRAPIFGHHNLLTDASGDWLSKRTGALSIASLRESGVEALAVAALAVLVGSAESVRPIGSLDELAATFELSQLLACLGALRCGRVARPFRSHAASDAVRGRARSSCRARNRRAAGRTVLGRGARQPDASGRGAGLVGGGSRRSVAGGRRCRVHRNRRGASAAGTLERRHLERLDRGAQARDRAQGQGPLSSLALGADRPRVRP